VSRKSSYSGGARFVPKGFNGKLAPVEQRLGPNGNKRLIAQPPFVALTDVSIAATCSDQCAFKGAGCYQQTGYFTWKRAVALDTAANGRTADEVVAAEVSLIDRSFRRGVVPQDGGRDGRGGRDLRLHVGGDVGSAYGAQLLASAADRWHGRGGGAVWTFTHWWRQIPRVAFGRVSVLASVEVPQDIEVARVAGYASAIVVDKFLSDRAFELPGTTAKIVPCPAETKGTTCIECRLCLDADKLLERNVTIAFAAHGSGKRRVQAKLVQLRTNKQLPPDNGNKKDEASTPRSGSTP
jgi:hypothetical protein